MQDQHKWRDRFEIALDGRQIFWIFAGSVVALSLVFSLGVVVGRRLAADVQTRPETDPLALLDQLSQGAAEDQDDLVFSRELVKDRKPSGHRQQPVESHADEPKASEPSARPAPKVMDPPDRPAPKASELPDRPSKKPEEAPKASPAVRPAAAEVATAVRPLPSPPSTAAPKSSNVAAAPVAANNGAGSYTLQLSAFQERAEAEQFVASLRTSGLNPQLVTAEIPDRGTWYRVRVGAYKTWEQAVAAKRSFERDHGVIAYVTKR